MHIGGKIGQAIEKPFQYVDEGMHHVDNYLRGKNAPDMYIGYNSNEGPIVQIQPNYQQPGINTGYSYGNTRTSSTGAYKANVAGTANKIAQGGMTKDDILKYNIKHPNEIAGDNPANTTALNDNTAIRSN